MDRIAKGKRCVDKNIEQEEWKARGWTSSSSQDAYKNAKIFEGKKMVGMLYTAGCHVARGEGIVAARRENIDYKKNFDISILRIEVDMMTVLAVLLLSMSLGVVIGYLLAKRNDLSLIHI